LGAKLQIMNKKVLITGASGLVGTQLTAQLIDKGYEVQHVGRRAQAGKIKSFVWNIERGEFDPHALEGVDTVIHLAGAGVADKRWTNARKQEILQSRVKSTELLLNALTKYSHQVACVVSASAIGYYGFGMGEQVFDETSKGGSDFLAEVTRQWEQEVDKISPLGIRVVKMRIGIVLSNQGGALAQMALPIKLGLGSPLATGKQYVSWIHIEDLCAMFIQAIEDTRINDSFNATTDWATNATFTRAIAEVLKKPLFLPNVPAYVLKLLVGEMANMIINGSKVTSQKIQSLGFKPRYPTLMVALNDLLKK
jgi:uncharacterized protein (TIGR01777 family)